MLLECPQEPDKVWQSDVEEEAKKKMLHLGNFKRPLALSPGAFILGLLVGLTHG